MSGRTGGTADRAPDLARRLAISYSALVRGLRYRGSESDSYFRPFYAAASEARFDLTNFRSTAGLLPAWDLRAESGVHFLEMLARWERQDSDGDPTSAATAAAAYKALAGVMRAASTGSLHHVIAAPGESMKNAWHPTRHYVLGQVPGGLAGLVVFSTET